MRVIHLCFELKPTLPVESFADFTSDTVREAFEREDKTVYQPLFALLERNTQRYTKLKFSLIIPGVWLDLAEKFDRELIERLRKLIDLGRVEMIVEPYYHSLPFFAEPGELAAQVKLQQEKLAKLFGAQSKILALPALTYNNAIGKWAGDYGFAGMLLGASTDELTWHSPNHVYEAPDCKYLRLLVRNGALSDQLMRGDTKLLAEKPAKDDTPAKTVFSVDKFIKAVELDTLRGNLINLVLDAQIFQTQAEHGIVGFFDELFGRWLEGKGQHFATAMEACTVEQPKQTLSLLETVSELDGGDEVRGSVEDEAKTGANDESQQKAVIVSNGQDLPSFLRKALTQRAHTKLYTVCRAVIATGDDELLAEIRNLTPIEYTVDMNDAVLAKWEEKLNGLQKRSDEIKRAQVTKISETYTKRHDRGEVESDGAEEVQVKVAGKRSASKESEAGNTVSSGERLESVAEADDATKAVGAGNENSEKGDSNESGAVTVHFGSRGSGTKSQTVHGADQAEPGETAHRLDPKPAKKKRGVRRIVRKFVIE